MIQVKDDETKGSGTRKSAKGRSQGRRQGSGRRGSGSAKSLDVRKVFLKELMDVADAHAQLARVLPQIRESLDARGAEEVLEFLERRIEGGQRSLTRVLEEHVGTNRQVVCKPVREMAQATARALRASDASMELNLLTITNLQKVIHYLIASLGSLRAWSELVEDEDAVLLFRRLTEDAKMADQELSRTAEDELWSRRRGGNGNGHMNG